MSQRRMGQRGVPFRARVLAQLAAYPDGTTIARITRPLADGTHGYDTVYRRIYGALRACERDGLAEQAGWQQLPVPVAWSLDMATRNGPQSPVIWKVTPVGAELLHRMNQEDNQS